MANSLLSSLENMSNLSKDELSQVRRELGRELARAEKEREIKCTHTPLSGAKLIPIKDYDGDDISNRDRKRFAKSETVFVCDECGSIIDLKQYSKDETFFLAFNMRSILNQINIVIGGKLGSQEKDELAEAHRCLDYLEKVIVKVYNPMVKRVEEQGENQRYNKGRGNKGGVGLNSGMMR